MILYLKDPKNSTQNLLDTINKYSRWQDTKSTNKNHYLGVNLTKDVNELTRRITNF
jgi:hypothetical protein